MAPRLRERKTELPSSPTLADAKPDYYSLLAGEDHSFGDTSGIWDSDLNGLIQRILHRNCDAVCKQAASRMPELRKVVGRISNMIAADLEARILRAARAKGRGNSSRGKRRNGSPLDMWVTDIQRWTESQHLPLNNESDESDGCGDSNGSDESQCSDDSELVGMDADYVATFFESFMLFVAHHISEYFMSGSVSELLDPEDCRLILPIASCDMEAEGSDASLVACVDPVDFTSFECGMFPIGSSVEKQVAPTPHLVVGDAEVVRHKSDCNEAEQRLAKKTMALFFSQHNRRFAWGLTARSCTARAYVFGMDDIWASTDMDIASTEGRLALVSLLVDWSLCPVDHLGFDPSIRYTLSNQIGNPYLEMDIYEVDESMGLVEKRTYYSQRCVGAADHLTGRHTRYFAASTDPKLMGEPAVLIKDVWSTAGNSSASDTRESSALNILHAEFDRSSEFSDSFARFVSTGPVYIKQGDALVEDTTTTAFVGLPSVSQARQHRRTMTKLEGSLISEADDESKVVIATADAMAALHAVHVKCKILHGNISDRAILLQKTADGIKGVLADFDYVSIDGDSVVETPELKSFQSIHSLRNPGAARTFLDDAESLLYLVCWLGTFGINHEQRAQHVAGPGLLILHWSKGAAAKIAAHKRLHMANTDTFGEAILSGMRNVNGPLYRLALSIYRALFARPGCVGTIPVSNLRFGNAGVPNAVRVLDTESNPLVLRNRFVNDIKGNPLEILDRYRKTALAALHTDRAP